MEIKNVTKVLFEFQRIPKLKKAKTFLEISGYPHFENVCSNILQFFLNPFNEHGLKDLILDSLVKLVDKDFNFDCDFESIEVEREVITLSGNRLDLLIITDKYVIGIENKIFHFLNNDLSDYSKTIASYCQHPNKKAINLILSLNKLSSKQDKEKANADNFIAITYDDLFKSIRKNAGEFISHNNPTYLIYLTDFMKTIQNLKQSTMENRILWNFLSENSEVIQELTNKFKEYQSLVFEKANRLKEFLPQKEFAPLVTNQWIWDGRNEGVNAFALVHDYLITNKFKISIDATIDIKGWRITLFGRDLLSKEYLFNQMCADSNFLEKSLDKYERNSRILIQRFDTEVELEKVAVVLKDLLVRVENYKQLMDNDEIMEAKQDISVS